MRQTTNILRTTTITAALISACGASVALAQGSGNQQTLHAVLRDFRPNHPDFAVSTPGSNAGNVGTTLDSSGKPMYTGGGSSVFASALDANGNPISPHLADETIVPLTDFVIHGGHVVPNDRFMASVQVLGAAIQNSGRDRRVTFEVEIGGKVIEPFGAMDDADGANVNDGRNPRSFDIPAVFNAGTPISITARSYWFETSNPSVHFERSSATDSDYVLVLRDGDSVPNIKGFQNQSTIVDFVEDYIDPDTKLVTLAPNDAIFLFEIGTSNLGASSADFQDLVLLVTLDTTTSASLSSVVSTPSSPCAPSGADSLATMGAANNGGVSSADNFSSWFRSSPTQNASGPDSLTLSESTPGVYGYSTSDFTPANMRLFGNDTGSTNRNFTYEFSGTFTASHCSGQFFQYAGGGDVWVFINGELVMDVGGGGDQRLDFDRLNLVDGEQYELSFFYAQRTSGPSPFALRTSVQFNTKPNAYGTFTAVMD